MQTHRLSSFLLEEQLDMEYYLDFVYLFSYVSIIHLDSVHGRVLNRHVARSVSIETVSQQQIKCSMLRLLQGREHFQTTPL